MSTNLYQPASTVRKEPQNPSLSRLKFRRQRWLTVHLWLGLTLGLLLSIYGITGSILVFYPELDEWLHPDMLVVEVPADAEYRPLAEIFAAGKAAMPPQAKHNFATYPRNEFAAFKLRFAVADANGAVERWEVGVDPYTAKISGKQLQGRSSDWLPSTFIGLMFELHYALLLPNDISTVVVGLSGILLIISTLTGLIVWWPLTGRWRQALLFKAGAGKVRFNYDLHKTSGFYTMLAMIPVLFSGVYMVLPHNVVAVLEVFSPATYRYWFQSTPPHPGAPAIGMAQAVAIARQQYPTGRPSMIYGAAEPTKTYTVCQDGVDAPGSLLQRRCTVIDRYSAKILDRDDPSLPTASAGEIFTHWQWPLHSGQVFGMTGRILVFITGLVCPVLFVTGVIRWRQKAATRHRRKG
ncbi:PepSY-associated TM helix domain-containing protein [Methylomonas rosea]|uniref:PepSY domain-containing protein n=1 Tax=Methylomonas rosea TaxID=2952227 RepID=A0ABT1TSD3_9GAMM|nr:PepSY-associated TM helix domain-containing protein [Methylomonas sp. WSC-7]MCQ8117701.1 PepSY domain-containing protein [Methylomonas sp. WSC-7]